MTNDEAKQAFFDDIPVILNGIEYERISALIYRKKGSTAYLELELYDKCGHSVSVAPAEKVIEKVTKDYPPYLDCPKQQ